MQQLGWRYVLLTVCGGRHCGQANFRPWPMMAEIHRFRHAPNVPLDPLLLIHSYIKGYRPR